MSDRICSDLGNSLVSVQPVEAIVDEEYEEAEGCCRNRQKLKGKLTKRGETSGMADHASVCFYEQIAHYPESRLENAGSGSVRRRREGFDQIR
jgi:hypothetical protein